MCFACRIGGNCKFRKSLDASHMPVNSIYVLKEKVCRTQCQCFETRKVSFASRICPACLALFCIVMSYLICFVYLTCSFLKRLPDTDYALI